MWISKREHDHLKRCVKEADEHCMDLQNQIKMSEESYELREKKAVAALEDKLARKTNELERSYDKKLHDFKSRELAKTNEKFQKMIEENYGKLSTELGKLHSEGNVQTKFIQDMNKEMLSVLGLSAKNNAPLLEE